MRQEGNSKSSSSFSLRIKKDDIIMEYSLFFGKMGRVLARMGENKRRRKLMLIIKKEA